MIDATGPRGGTPSDSSTKMDEAAMDRMVQTASTPSLATLFQRGKDAGLLKPQQEYGHTT